MNDVPDDVADEFRAAWSDSDVDPLIKGELPRMVIIDIEKQKILGEVNRTEMRLQFGEPDEQRFKTMEDKLLKIDGLCALLVQSPERCDEERKKIVGPQPSITTLQERIVKQTAKTFARPIPVPASPHYVTPLYIDSE